MVSVALLIAFVGALLPALLWLAFWLLEDRCEPEPKKFIVLCFILGGAVVLPVVLPLERLAVNYASGSMLLFLWAAIEELAKFGAAYIAALRWHVFDEPLDAVVYMVTAALGFAAFENMLFLLAPLQDNNTMQALITGDLRFIGATLLHVLASGTIGLSLAFAFYKKAAARRKALILGVILAIVLHGLFNFFILNQVGSAAFWTFLCLWMGIIAILLLVERVKHPQRDYC